MDGLKSTIAQMVASSSFDVRPTAIYANPVLLDLIDREMKTEFNVVLSTTADHGRTDGKNSEHASRRTAADSGVGASLYRHSGKRHRSAAGVHRHRGPDRVSLADGSESASVQAGTAEHTDDAKCRGEIRRVVVKGASYAHYEVQSEPVVERCGGFPLIANMTRRVGRPASVRPSENWTSIMNYLQPSEYELYGLEATTALAWVTAASAIIDAHCRRITLAINQYTERLRTENGHRPVRLTYLPLNPVAPATSPIVSAQARYATPRRGELEYEAMGGTWLSRSEFRERGWIWTSRSSMCLPTREKSRFR